MISVLMVFTMIPLNVAAESSVGSLDNFKRTLTYEPGRFSDVKSSDWFADNVAAAYEYQLVNGTSATSYEPNSNITIAQTITLAVRLHRMFYGKGEFIITGWNDPWYQPYVDYAVENGIIKSGEYTSSSFNNNASRRRFAYIMASALPSEALSNINNIAMGKIPDVSSDNEFAAAVYQLYNAGILTGNDEYGTFLPNSNIRRSEVAAIVTRMADTKLRKSFKLKEFVQKGIFGTFYKASGLKMTIEDASWGGNKDIKVTVEGEAPVILSFEEKHELEFTPTEINFVADDSFNGKGMLWNFSRDLSTDDYYRMLSLQCVCDNNGNLIGGGVLFADCIHSFDEFFGSEYMHYYHNSGFYTVGTRYSGENHKDFNDFTIFNLGYEGPLDYFYRADDGSLLYAATGPEDSYNVKFYLGEEDGLLVPNVMSYTIKGNSVQYKAYKDYEMDEYDEIRLTGQPSDEIVFDMTTNTITLRGKKYKLLGQSLEKAVYDYFSDQIGESYPGIMSTSDILEYDSHGNPTEAVIHLYEDHDDHISTVGWYYINIKTLKGKDLLEEPVDLRPYF